MPATPPIVYLPADERHQGGLWRGAHHETAPFAHLLNVTSWLPNARYGIISAHKCTRAAGHSRVHGRPVREVIMDSIPRTSGVYQIRCIPTGKVYIGSAIDLVKRRNSHWKDLKDRRHHNIHLQRAWDKYGEASFIFEVVELVLSPFLTAREQCHINRVKSFKRERGFNVAPIAGSSLGIKRTEEAREKMRNRIISDVTRAKIGALRKGKPTHPNSLRAIEEGRSDWWEVTNPEGVTQTVRNLTAFCREHGLSFSAMKNVASGGTGRHSQRQHRGWTCRKVRQQ